MVIYPCERHTYKYNEKVESINESLCDLATLRQDLGDQLFNAVLKNRSKVVEVLNHRKNLRENGRYLNYPTKTNDKRKLAIRLKEKLESRLTNHKHNLNTRIRSAIKLVIKVGDYCDEVVTRDDNQPYSITASCYVRGGWRSNRTDYKANVPFNWIHTPASKVMAAFDNKFFVLECRREAELDHEGMKFYWVNRAVRTRKVGFNPPEVGYAAINDNEFCGWGTTPELAAKSLKKDIVKAAKARLLATLKA
jgi:hypothetical protein